MATIGDRFSRQAAFPAGLTEARRKLNATLTEKQFQEAVVALAETRGFNVFHDHDSRRNAAGLPDLLLVRPPRLLFAELKASRGVVRPEQRRWLELLGACPGVEVHVWRPDDWSTIERVLA